MRQARDLQAETTWSQHGLKPLTALAELRALRSENRPIERDAASSAFAIKALPPGSPRWFSPTCSFGASSLLVRIGAEADLDLWVLTENFGAQELLCCPSLRAFVSLGNPTRTKPNVGPRSPPLRTEWYVMCTSGTLRTEWYVTCNSCFRKRPVLEKLDGQCLSRRPIAAKARVQIHCSEQNDFLGPTGVLVGTRAGALLVHHASAAFQKP